MALAVVALALAWSAGPAWADVSGLGPGDSLGDPAGPMQMGVEYSGAFKSDHDLDHVLFSVANPGSTLQFVVTNTYGGCNPNNYCPIWGTLLDTAGGQLGGEGSGAGTGPVGPQTSDSIVWTFPAAGNYVLVLEGNGDPATYRFAPTSRMPVPEEVAEGAAPRLRPLRSPACTRPVTSAGRRSGPASPCARRRAG